MNILVNYKTVFVYFIFLICFSPAFSQTETVEITRSEEKVLIDGKMYYIHTVKPGQTIYSISRAYGVTEQDIALANPSILLEVIKPDQALKIPVISNAPELPENYFGLSKKDFIYHKIRQGQTIYFLSKKYNISKEILYEYNPEARSGLQIDQVIKIPKKHVILKKHGDEIEESNKFFYYEIKPKDTLYSLSRKYGVTVADIISLNEELRWGPRAGQLIRIPKPDYFKEMVYRDSLLADTIKSIQYTSLECDSISYLHKGGKMQVALLLPFFSDYIEVYPSSERSGSSDDDAGQEIIPELKQDASRGSRFIEYYEGMLLAVDSLKKTGLDISLYVFDTKGDTNQMKSILTRLEFIEPDLIIGPVNHENIDLTASFAHQHNINLVSPLSAYNNILHNNPRIFQIIPSLEAELFYYAGYISEFHNNNIVLIHNEDEDDAGMQVLDIFRHFLFFHLTSKSTYDNTIYKEVRLNDTLTQNLFHSLAKDEENIVIVASANEAYVSDVLNLLNTSLKHYSISVVGLPAWQRFDKVQQEYFHNLQIKLYSPFCVNYKDKHTKTVLRKFRDYYNYEPYRMSVKGFYYGLLGYDVGLYFLSALHHYGNDFSLCVHYLDVDLTLSEFYFYRNNQNEGFQNASINFIEYNKDLSVRKMKQELHSDPQNIRISLINREKETLTEQGIVNYK